MMTMAMLTASAQYEPGTFSVQPRLGATGSLLTNMPGMEIDVVGKKIDSEATGGFIVGADLEYQLTNLISLSAGLNWGQAGSGWENFKYKEEGITYESKDLKIQTSYLNVPITANFYVWKGLAIRTGVQMGFLTSAKMKQTITASGKQGSTNINSTTETDESCKDYFKKFDISIPVGLSYEFKNHLVIDARYNIGLSKANKEKLSDGKDTKNMVFALTLGYKIKL